MDTEPHYSKAPITEAIIDFRVKLPEGTAVAQLERCGIEEKERYPNKKNLNVTVGRMELGDKLETSASTQHVGFMFTSSDGKHIFQAHLNGFTLNRLAPYDCWQSFRDEARRLWKLYRAVAQPLAVERVAVRYVNRLDLPLPLPDLKEYLRTVPEVSADLPQNLAGFFMQLNIPQADLRSTLLVNQTMIDSPTPGVVSIVLDVDLFRDADLPTDDEGVWRFLDELRVRKNQVFEACITDRTRELIR